MPRVKGMILSMLGGISKPVSVQASERLEFCLSQWSACTPWQP